MLNALQIPAAQPGWCGQEKADYYSFYPYFNFTPNLKEHTTEKTVMWVPADKDFFCSNIALQFPLPGYTLLTFGNYTSILFNYM